MLSLQNISYLHPNKDLLFSNIHFTINKQEKTAIIGDNGVGKSTLLKIIAGKLVPSSGQKNIDISPYDVPQLFGQYNHLTIAQALNVDHKITALQEILKGNVSEENYLTLADDWTIEERCYEALQHWQLLNLDLSQSMGTLSGGQKTKVFLAGIAIHQPQLVLLDEPSNHLDRAGRQLLYNYIRDTKSTLIVISHDKILLDLIDNICELHKNGVKIYGGNYTFYQSQKHLENNALSQDIQTKEKALRKAKVVEKETIERQQKLDSRGKAKQEKAGIARIMLNTLKNNAENSSSKLKSIHDKKVDGLAQELQNLRASVNDNLKMKFGFDNSALHKGKVLIKAEDINFSYETSFLWKKNLNFLITSGQRIALMGNNGSGKTTLIKLLLGTLSPQTGKVYHSHNQAIYIDQDYSLLDNQLTVYQQAQHFNSTALHEHEIKIRLNRFLFSKEDWDKPCLALSGGERMRLSICCLNIYSKSPDIIILDEPTNNLDIQNVTILTNAINEYQGTIIVVSHDDVFLESINIEQSIHL